MAENFVVVSQPRIGGKRLRGAWNVRADVVDVSVTSGNDECAREIAVDCGQFIARKLGWRVAIELGEWTVESINKMLEEDNG